MELAVGAVLLVLFSVFSYLPSFDVPFVFDDLPNIVENPRVQPDGPAELPRALDARGARDRPVAMLSFALNYLADGLDPFGYHLVNLAIHVINGLLLLLLLASLARSRPPANGVPASSLAIFAALIWALHPVNTQAVTYIVQRMTSLATLFYLVAMLAFVLWRNGRVGGWVAAVSIAIAFAAGMGSKAIVITLPAMLLLIDWVFFDRFGRWHRIALVSLALAVPLLVLALVGNPLGSAFSSLPGREFSAYERVLTEGRVLWHYLSLYAFPLPDRLQLDYEFSISRGWLQPATTFIAWSAIALLTCIAFRFARRFPWPCFAWLFFIGASSIEASFLNLELVFEHRIYLPCLFLAAGLLASIPFPSTRAVVTIPVMALVGALAWGTLERNSQWQDFTAFWAEEIERGASPLRATINASGRLSRAGRYVEAMELIRRYDGPLEGMDGLRLRQVRGEVLFGMGEYGQAVELFEAIRERAPDAGRPAYFLAQAYLQLGDIQRADSLAARMRGRTEGPFIEALEAILALNRGEPAEGVERLRAYIETHPSQSAAQEAMLRLHVAHLLRALDQPEAAMTEYRRIVDLDPQNWAAWSLIYQMLTAGGDIEQAAKVKRYMEHHGADPEGW